MLGPFYGIRKPQKGEDCRTSCDDLFGGGSVSDSFERQRQIDDLQ